MAYTKNWNNREHEDDFWDALKPVAGQVLLGNYSDDVTPLGTLAQVGLGMAGLDLPMDIRDLTYDLTNWEWTPGHVAQTLLDAVVFLPVVGSLKYADEFSDLLKNADVVADLAKKYPELAALARDMNKLDDVLGSVDEVTDVYKNAPEVTDLLKDTGKIVDLLDSSDELIEGAGNNIVGSKFNKVRPTQDVVNPKKVQDYAKRLRAGEKIPPVQVVEVPGKGMYIINGHHRYVASFETGIPVEIKVVQSQGPIGMPDWSGVQWKEYISENQFWED